MRDEVPIGFELERLCRRCHSARAFHDDVTPIVYTRLTQPPFPRVGICLSFIGWDGFSNLWGEVPEEIAALSLHGPVRVV